MDLILELSSGTSVEEALYKYTDIEILDQSVGWRCQKCEQVTAAQKQLTVYNAPNILIITLKRQEKSSRKRTNF